MEFSPATRAWFDAAFSAPTEAQARGWEAIGRGDHTLILAPTGSGKTLAAFLWALDRLIQQGSRRGCRVLYVSPLKALTYDVARNLKAPLAGIARQAERLGLEPPELRVATRTGDTPAEERRAMVRRPPDILITTPESLYLLLSSNASSVLATVEHVIVDEIHAVASTKRGTHLALSLERLEEISLAPVQRIGLSATQRPLDELARFLGGQTFGPGQIPVPRAVTIVDAGVRKPLELSVVVPVDDMAELTSASQPLSSIWPAIYPELLSLIRAHRSTLIFVNSRRLAERLAARLNELAASEGLFFAGGSAYMGAGVAPDVVRAHHGSIAREQRVEIEDALKAGTLPALVATSSLELGIDMGAVDLVVQVEAPTSVASGLQRIGRAGHQVGQPSKGRIFPKFRHDLLVAAAVAERMQSGLIEETRVARNPLDVLAQHVVAAVAAVDGPVRVDALAACVRRSYPYADLPRDAFEGVLDMLAGRYPSDEFAELRPRIVWDRVAGTLTARPGAKMLAVTSGGTIPDRGLYGVFTPEGGRVGELDEEMVYESRVGDTFLLGATTWRIEEITRDRVIVTPAPGLPGKMPFWHGDSAGRPFELGAAIGEFTRTLGARSDSELTEKCGLDPLAIKNLRAYVEEESEATGGLIPTDRQIVVERFRDELGDWRVAILSPFGARVHAPWALALETRLRERLGLEAQALWSDDGIIVRLPEAEDAPALDSVLIGPDDIEELVVSALGASALFAGRFRENAARALLLPRRRPGARTPLWQLRQRASDLQAVASQHGSFPVLLETYRECLQDVFDLPALTRLLHDLQTRKIRIAEVDLVDPSPFASGLVFAYVAQFMYEGDAPMAERRAQALTLDRRMLSDLLGTDEMRDLLDFEITVEYEAELQGLAADRRCSTVEEVADLLRRIGDLTMAELAARCVDPETAEMAWGALVSSRRALGVRVAGQDRLIAIEDAGRYRDGVGVVIGPGVPDAFLVPVADGLLQLVRRWARSHGPFSGRDPSVRFGVGETAVGAVLDQLAADARVVRGGFRPGGSGRNEWCDTEILRVLRQRSLAALRREVAPTDAEALARFLPAWHGVSVIGSDPEASGLDRLYEAIGQLEGTPIPASVLERDVLRSRVRDYEPRLLDELLASGEIMWVGAGILGPDDGRLVLARRDQASLVLPRLGYDGSAAPDLESELHRHIRATLAGRGACFFRELMAPRVTDDELVAALWDLVWAGEVTADGFGPVRAPGSRHVSAAGHLGRARRPRPGSVRLAAPPRGQGRWSLVQRELGTDGEPDRATTEAAVAVAGLLLERHGIVTRETVRWEGIPGGFASLYPVLKAMEESGRVRRGYFLTGMGGAQFALPGAVDRLRAAPRDPAGSPDPIMILAATDPANPYGAALPWPVRGATRVAGSYVVLTGGKACAYLEKGGRGVLALREMDGTWEEAAVGALSELVRGGRWRRLALQRYPDALAPFLEAAGFTPTPKGLTLYG
jgi:ATP-dependent Lhr-like helicase